jgi:autophagy-related protein 101
MAPENIPWEVWTIRTDIVQFTHEHDRQRWQEKVGEMLCDKVMYVAEVMNRHDYVPKMPSQADLELVFDTSLPEVQPYLFKISYATSGPSSPSVGTTVRRLLKDTLAI